MRVLRTMVAGVALLGASVGQVSGGEQMTQSAPQQPAYPTLGRGPADDNPFTPDLARKQEQARNNERQKRLVADTDKLLALATELKQDVDKTNKDVLSVDVIKKAEEIEKLAHNVKERMKG